ncbi:MAG: PIN domain-containing protein [Planctomycetia bacterium]|nr:PIN domain-containing protein [Planctomycetia bacterium]
MILLSIRLLFILVMASVGFSMAAASGQEGFTLYYLLGFIAAAIAVIIFDTLYRRKDISLVSAVFFGLVVGFVVSLLFGLVVDLTPWIESPELKKAVKIGIAAISSYVAISFIMQTRDDFRFVIPYIEFAKQTKGGRPLLLDTSIIIDGRIADISETRIIDSPLVVPRFILQELQSIADSPDKLKRNRGRRGLDMLNRLQASDKVDVTIDDTHVAETRDKDDVDQMLIAVAPKLGARIMTTDFNLAKVAQLRGIDVININDLANALKPIVLHGESMQVKVLRPGDEENQGVGYLDDGTMIVVENGLPFLGKDITLIVTSIIQTSAGRMIFGRPEGTRPPRREENKAE